MNQEPPVEPWIFSKLLSIWIVILVIIIATAVIAGGQVYWWQKTEAKKERQQLQQQIRDLQNEIKVLKSANTENLNKSKQITLNPKSTSGKKWKLLTDQLGGVEQKVIAILKNGDMKQLAQFVHTKRGIRFSPFAYIDLKKDLVFTSAQIPGLLDNYRKFSWGFNEENGLPIRLTPFDFYKNYVYDQPYADTNEISYSQTTSSEFTTSNCYEIYPNAIIVEYRVRELDSKESPNTNWRSIRLVFEKERGKWYLVGIIHDQWLL